MKREELCKQVKKFTSYYVSNQMIRFNLESKDLQSENRKVNRIDFLKKIALTAIFVLAFQHLAICPLQAADPVSDDRNGLMPVLSNEASGKAVVDQKNNTADLVNQQKLKPSPPVMPVPQASA